MMKGRIQDPLIVLFAMVMMVAFPVVAQDTGPSGGVSGSSALSTSGPLLLPDNVDAFGTGQQWTVLSASEWQAFNGAPGNIGFANGGYLYPLNSSDDFWAQVNLPVGAEIHFVKWLVYDNDVSCSWYLILRQYEGSLGVANPVQQDIVVVSNSASYAPGYVDETESLSNVVVRSWGDLDSDGTFGYLSFNVHAETLGCGGTSALRLFGAVFVWQRTISPAPGSATFPDVGTGFWAFQEIEALAASGITAGFPDGTFRPTANVTRAQMATFLARALGLHWPY